MSTDRYRTDRPALQVVQGRLAARIAGALAERAEQLPHDLAERLRVAREQALGRARLARPVVRPSAAQAVVGVGHGAVLLGGPASWWQRAASVLPLLLLVFGLLAVDRLTEREEVLVAAEVDTALLIGDVPPAAYADPGFAEFLRSPPP
jgi:hypothetical protein